MPGPRYGNTGFDALLGIPWDLKAHVTANWNGVLQPKLIVNDTEAVEAALREYGEVGVVLLQGSATYDDATGSFKTWHDRIKGEYLPTNGIVWAAVRRRGGARCSSDPRASIFFESQNPIYHALGRSRRVCVTRTAWRDARR